MSIVYGFLIKLVITEVFVVLVVLGDNMWYGVHQLHEVAQLILINGQCLHPFNPAPTYPSFPQKPFKYQCGPFLQSYTSSTHDPLDPAAQKAQLIVPEPQMMSRCIKRQIKI